MTSLAEVVVSMASGRVLSAAVVCTIRDKSVILALEISDICREISGRAKTATAVAATGSTKAYFILAHGLDFLFCIIVIRFISEL